MITTFLLQFVVCLVVVGLVLYLINEFVPMEAKVKQLLNTGVIVILILYLLVNVVGPLTMKCAR